MPTQRKASSLALVGALAGALLGATGCGGSGGPGASSTAVKPASKLATATASSFTTSSTAQRPAARPKPRPRPAARAKPPSAPRAQAASQLPSVVWEPIPFGPQRRAEMAAYAGRHYGSFMVPTWRLRNPRVIVIHYTDSSFSSAYSTFAADVPDVELHELPGTCAHFLIDTAGTIHQLVPLDTMCRHTVGLNWTSIGIEHVGFSDAQVLGNAPELSASVRLVRWLQCRYQIQTQNVIGHNESLSSPFHREDLAALRTQTHGDFNHASMDIYRSRLATPCA